MKLRVDKAEVDKSIEALFWAAGSHQEDGEPAVLIIQTGSNKLGFTLFNNGNMIQMAIPCETYDSGSFNVPFPYIRGAVGSILGGYLEIHTKSDFLVIDSEGSRIAIPSSDKQSIPEAPRIYDTLLHSSSFNRMAMQMGCASSDFTDFQDIGKRMNLKYNSGEFIVYFETSHQDKGAFFPCKVNSSKKNIDIEIDPVRFGHMMRGFTSRGFGECKMHIEDGRLWLSSPKCIISLPTYDSSNKMSGSYNSIRDNAKMIGEVSVPRSALIKIFEAMLFAKPIENIIRMEVEEKGGTVMSRFFTQGWYKITRLAHSRGKLSKKVYFDGKHLLKFLKTSIETVITIEVSESHLFIKQSNGLRYLQCLKKTA